MMSNKIQPPPVRDDGLQLAEDRVFQNRLWTVQRTAWIGFALVLMVALAGFTGGGGYFSKQTLQIGDATVVLPRISRREANDKMQLIVPDSSFVDVLLGPDFDRHYTINQIYPLPDRSLATARGLQFRFSLSGRGPKKIGFDLMATRTGWTSFDISIGSATRTVRTVVMP